MPITLPASAQPIGFRKHVTAILGANFVVATLVAIYVASLTAWNTGSGSVVVMLAIVTWMGTFAIAAPASGLLFTVAWPFLRRARALRLLLAVLVGAGGGYASVWANYAAVGKHATGTELATAVLLGTVLGAVYWMMTRQRSAGDRMQPPARGAPTVAIGPESHALSDDGNQRLVWVRKRKFGRLEPAPKS